MLKRPTARRRGDKEQIQLNLVPILDAMVTLIGFLLFSMSFLAFVSIESLAPAVSPERNAQLLNEKPLQLTLSVRGQESEIWSPFQKITAQVVPHLAEGIPDTKKIHEHLLSVKKQFPNETKIILAPNGSVNYDTLIAVMDSVRSIEKTDPPVFIKNLQTGAEQAAQYLFPEVVFGNLLSADDDTDGANK